MPRPADPAASEGADNLCDPLVSVE